MTDKKDYMDEFDEVVQMQLSEFQRHILGATNADVVAIIIETNGVVQCATGSTKYNELEGRVKSSTLILQIGAALIGEQSAGQFELRLHNKATGDSIACGEKIEAVIQVAP